MAPTAPDPHRPTDYQTLTYQKSANVATVTLNRPDRMNGMTSLMVREAHDALTAAAGDESVSVLVLTGAGSSFCPGADLRAATARERDVPADAHHFQVPVLLHEMPAITIAAVNGACAGAGFGWACGCDVRVAARSAMFNTAFLNVAVAGDMGLPWSLPRLVGASRARELSFFSEKFNAEEAQRIGLVARVWDDAVFRAETDQLVARLAGAAPLALKTLKAHYRAAESGVGFGDYVALETTDHLRIVKSADTAEAFRAFLEKRAPVFTGR
jgi:2-(1,2-epoxy-1,2-dihydrophenyl)acetyl-CoA isomerase